MVKRIIYSTLLFILVSCAKEECPWPKPTVNIRIGDSSSRWLQEIPLDTIITAISNKGRTISYSLKPRFSYDDFGTAGCNILSGEKHFINYTSSLYDYNFNILIYRHWDIDKFLLCGINEFDYFHNDTRSEINLNNKNIKRTTITTNNYYNNYVLDTTYSIIDTLKLNNKIYTNVYKIDFIDKKYSIDEKVKVYYVDSKKGVLKFETFDNEIWTINY